MEHQKEYINTALFSFYLLPSLVKTLCFWNIENKKLEASKEPEI